MTIMQTAELLSKIAPKTTIIARFDSGSEPVSYAFFEVVNNEIIVSVERFDELVKLPVASIAIPPTLIKRLTEEPVAKTTKKVVTKERAVKIQKAIEQKSVRTEAREKAAAVVAAKRAAHKDLVEQRKQERAAAVAERRKFAALNQERRRVQRAEALSDKKERTAKANQIRQAVRAILRAEETGSEKLTQKALKMVDKLKAA